MNYKNVLIFGVGVATGVLGTWKFFAKKSEEQITSMENVLNKQIAKNKPATDAEANIFSEQEATAKEPKKEESSIDVSELKKATNLVSYNAYISSSPNEKLVSESKSNPPYLIDQEDWENCANAYAKIEVGVYDDGAIVNENNDELLDADWIGMDNLKLFLETDPNATVMYVRNPELMMDFEVAKTNGSYAEMEGL